MTTPPLVKQPRDECRLEQDYSTNRQDLCTILIPYRRISLQSNFGAANPVAGTLMSPALSPPRMRMATEAVRRLPSLTECIGPPTIARPKKASLCEKMGALATARSLVNALSPS